MYTNIHETISKLGSFVLALFALSVSAIDVLHAQDEEIDYYVKRDMNEEGLLLNGLMAVRWLLWPDEFDSSWPLYAYSMKQIQQECEEAGQGYNLGEHPLGYGVVATEADDNSGRFEVHPLLAVNSSGNDSADVERTDHITLSDVCRRADSEDNGDNVWFATQRPIFGADVALRLSKDIEVF